MTYDEYEKLVGQYFQRILKNSFSESIEIKHQENLFTVAGREYNIDLNYKFKVGSAEYLTIIECKYWKNTVTRDIVLALKEKANDLAAHKAILVTTKGFQKGAVEYALEKGIGLIKITPQGEEETFANFTGVDLTKIFTELIAESVLPDNNAIENNIGIVFPEKTVIQYLEEKYGKQLITAMAEFKNNADNYQPSDEVLSILNNIPNNWYDEYLKIETGGLNMQIFNQDELRVYNVYLYLMKVRREAIE